MWPVRKECSLLHGTCSFPIILEVCVCYAHVLNIVSGTFDFEHCSSSLHLINLFDDWGRIQLDMLRLSVHLGLIYYRELNGYVYIQILHTKHVIILLIILVFVFQNNKVKILNSRWPSSPCFFNIENLFWTCLF